MDVALRSVPSEPGQPNALAHAPFASARSSSRRLTHRSRARADGQILTPPNLFTASGALAPRPAITVSADVAENGETITVTSTRPLASIAIVRLGTATHSVNTDQRRLELCGPAAGACGGASPYDVDIPADPGIALTGNWMVFGVDTAGTPSVASIIKIGAAPAGVEDPTATGGTAAEMTETFEATPADPAIPMPPGTQLE